MSVYVKAFLSRVFKLGGIQQLVRHTKGMIVWPVGMAMLALNPESPAQEILVSYKKTPFWCRWKDRYALEEVLINDEYGPICELLAHEQKPVVVDWGANIGTFAIRVFSERPEAYVVSVEAASDTYEVLRHSCTINGARRWKTIHSAIWGKSGTVALDVRELSTSTRVQKVAASNGEHVTALSPDEFFKTNELHNVDLLKMDIEGGEASVIPAMDGWFDKISVMAIEIHSDRIDPKPILEKLSNAYRYQWELKDRKSSKPLYVYTRHRIESPGIVPLSV